MPDAAAKLRRYLESVSRELALDLVAQVPFRAGNDFELGDLPPSVMSKMDKVLGQAADVAASWGNKESHAEAVERRRRFKDRLKATNCEQWAINKAVHYSEWAKFTSKDFALVVDAFKALLEEFRCPACGGWMYVTPSKGDPDSLRCACAAINLNLRRK